MAGGSASKSKTKSAGAAPNRKPDPDTKDKVAKKKSNKAIPPSPVQKPIMSPNKDKAMNKKPSSRRVTKSVMAKVSTEDKPRTSNRRLTPSVMGSVLKPISVSDKLLDETQSTSKTMKVTSEVSASMSIDATASRTHDKQKKGTDEQEMKEKKRLSKELTMLKTKRIQNARKLDEKVNRCRTKGRPLMVEQVEARQEIERAEANLKEWTKQFGLQMNELTDYLTKEMGEIRNGMKELEEMEIKTEMEAKHIRGAKLPEESLLRTIRLAVKGEKKEEEGDGEWMQRCTTADDEETKEMAIECASGGGEESVEMLLEFLQDESSDIREKAAVVLGEREYGRGTRLNPFVLRIGREKEYSRREEKEDKEEKGMNLFDVMVDNPYKESRLIGECAYTREVLRRIKL